MRRNPWNSARRRSARLWLIWRPQRTNSSHLRRDCCYFCCTAGLLQAYLRRDSSISASVGTFRRHSVHEFAKGDHVKTPIPGVLVPFLLLPCRNSTPLQSKQPEFHRKWHANSVTPPCHEPTPHNPRRITHSGTTYSGRPPALRGVENFAELSSWAPSSPAQSPSVRQRPPTKPRRSDENPETATYSGGWWSLPKPNSTAHYSATRNFPPSRDIQNVQLRPCVSSSGSGGRLFLASSTIGGGVALLSLHRSPVRPGRNVALMGWPSSSSKW